MACFRIQRSLKEDDTTPIEVGEKGLRILLGVAKLMLGSSVTNIAGPDDLSCMDKVTKLSTR